MAERERVRRRFWAEAGLATLTGVLTIVTLITPDWIEVLFEVDPDEGSGSLEWGLVLALFVATVVLAVVARIEWRRPASA